MFVVRNCRRRLQGVLIENELEVVSLPRRSFVYTISRFKRGRCVSTPRTYFTTPPRLWIDWTLFLFTFLFCFASARDSVWREKKSLVNQVDHELETKFLLASQKNEAKFKASGQWDSWNFFLPIIFRSIEGAFDLIFSLCFSAVLNVAAGKAPMQISTDGAGIPQKAIDGSTSSFFSADTCSLTKSERVPWWYVNLLEPYMVQLVRLDFGKSCCGKWNRTCFVWNHHPACKECCRTWDSAFLCRTVFGRKRRRRSVERETVRKLSPILFSSIFCFLFKVHMQINSKPKNH